MQQSSILAEAFVAPLMTLAQHNLARDRALTPVLFVKQAGRAPLTIGLNLPGEPLDRQRYFAKLGKSLRQQGSRILEAVLLMEGWFVSAQRAPLSLAVRPSQHPHRQEAIVLIGRNARNSQMTHVIPPFRRDSDGQPVWEKRPLAVYNQTVGKGAQATGLLDYLFAAEEGR